MFVTRLCD